MWGRILPHLSQLLGAPGIPWLVAASLQSLPPSSHSLLQFVLSSSTSSSPLARIHVTGFMTHLDNPDDLENLSLIASVKLFIQIGSHSQVLGGMFLEATINPCQVLMRTLSIELLSIYSLIKGRLFILAYSFVFHKCVNQRQLFWVNSS